jgi:hypothetical protein
MTIGELITRLQSLPPDALAVRPIGGYEYYETGDRMDVVDVYQSLDTHHDYRWWDCQDKHRNEPELYRVRQAVIL